MASKFPHLYENDFKTQTEKQTPKLFKNSVDDDFDF